MNILDTFYVLFKTNADDVKKGLDDVDKKAKETEKGLKNSNEEADRLGKSFVKMIEGGAALTGAFAGFSLLKNGVIHQTDYNKQLYITATLHNQQASKLKEIAQAAAQFGGTREGALSDLTANAILARRMGYAGNDPLEQIKKTRELYKRYAGSPGGQEALLSGFQDQGIQMMIAASDQEFNELMASKGVKAAGSMTKEQAKNAFTEEGKMEELSGAVGKLETTISDKLSGVISKLIDKLTELISQLGGTAGGAATVAGGVIAAKAAQYAIGGKVVARVLGIGGGAAAEAGGAAAGGVGTTAAGVGMAAAGAAGAAAMAGGGMILYGANKLFDLWSPWIESKLVEHMNKDLVPAGGVKRPLTKMGSAAPLTNSVSGQTDMAFWMSQGYTSDQAAGIIANMQRESSGNPNAIGDNGAARGLFQWHKDRQKAIFAATGIDVTTASREDQMKAAAWEMKNGNQFNDKAFRDLKGADTAGSYFSKNFERPGDAAGEAMIRGQMALSLASQYQGAASAPTSISIDKIEVHTQATDAQGIANHIQAAMTNAYSDVQSKLDNGRGA